MRSDTGTAVVERKTTFDVPVINYKWTSPERRACALQLYERQLQCRGQGLHKQELMLQEQILQVYELDLSEKAISVARQLGFKAKPFALIPGAVAGRHFTVEGENWYWELVPVERVDSPIPPEALRAMAWGHSHGLEGYWVAYPAPQRTKLPGFALTHYLMNSARHVAQTATTAVHETLENLDPVLVMLVGWSGITIELCRWK